MDAAEDGEFCVALRSALLRDRTAHLYRRRRDRRRLRPGRRAGRDRAQARGAAAAARRLRAPASSRRPLDAAAALACRRAVEREVLARGRVRTSIRPSRLSPRRARSRSLDAARRRARAARRPARGRARAASRAAPRTRRARSASAWGRNSKIPPPSLLTTTIRTGTSALRAAPRAPFMSWKRPRSPVTIQVGPAARGRGADPGRDQAVDPVGAAVGEEADLGGAGRQERLLVADRHARGGVDEVAVGVERRRGRACRPGSVGPRAPSSSAAIAASAAARRRRARRRVQPSVPALAVGQLGGEARRRAAAGRRGRSRRRPRRLVPAVAGSTRAGAAARGRASHWRSGLLVGISPKRRTSSGSRRVGPGAGDRVVGRRRPASGRAGRGEAARSARRGSDSRSRAASAGDRLAQRRGRPAPGDDQPARGGARSARPASSSSAGAGGERRGGRPSVSGPVAAALERQRRGRGDVARARLGAERVAPGDVQVDRARPRVAGAAA